jgi:hypothetical protein
MSTLQRDQEIIERYQGGSTATELSRSYGLSEPRIRQIVAGIKKVRQGREQRPVSDAHKRLGRRVYDFRFDNQLSRRFMATKLGWSVSKLYNLEEGLVDPTLLDLQDIATFMKCNLGDLINNVFSRH